MKPKTRGLVIALTGICVAVAVIFIVKGGGDAVQPAEAAETDLPKIVDYGSMLCLPCKEMAVILEEVKREYAGRVSVEIVDVYDNYDEAMAVGIQVIPTQIFYDAAGNEVFRHTGVMTKAEIVEQLERMGVD